MATLKVQEDSSISHCTYHVFLSFRGKDTCKTFTDHLYTALVQAGFRTFKDDEDIESGESIKLELHKAIPLSRISVIVYSKNFASSKCCLDELLTILECKRTSKHVVVPVFYDVDPTEVKNQTGSFAEAFMRHEQMEAENDERKNEWMEKVKNGGQHLEKLRIWEEGFFKIKLMGNFSPNSFRIHNNLLCFSKVS